MDQEAKLDPGDDTNLRRVADPTLREIYKWRFAQGVPDQVSRRAHWLAHTLLAAVTAGDVDLLGGMVSWPGVAQ
jgi:hypothetical protein